jgi:hypothetical protein
MVNDRSRAAQSMTSPAFETIVWTASVSGRTSTSSSAPIMAATASLRLPHSHVCTCRMTGPRRHDNHRGPDDRAEEGPQDPNRQCDQRDDDQHAQRGAREVDAGEHVSSLRLHEHLDSARALMNWAGRDDENQESADRFGLNHKVEHERYYGGKAQGASSSIRLSGWRGRWP